MVAKGSDWLLVHSRFASVPGFNAIQWEASDYVLCFRQVITDTQSEIWPLNKQHWLSYNFNNVCSKSLNSLIMSNSHKRASLPHVQAQ